MGKSEIIYRIIYTAFFSGNYDGIEPSMLEGCHEILLAYHHQMATEPRIRHHYRGITRTIT